MEEYSGWQWGFLVAHKFWTIKIPSDISDWAPVKHCIESYYQMVDTVHVSQLLKVSDTSSDWHEDYDSDEYCGNPKETCPIDSILDLPIATGVHWVRTSLEDQPTKLLEKMSVGADGLFDSRLAAYHPHTCTIHNPGTPARVPYASLEDWVYRCKKCAPSARYDSRDACMSCIMTMRHNNLENEEEAHRVEEFEDAIRTNWPAAHSEKMTMSGFVKHMVKYLGPELFCAASMDVMIPLYKEYCSALAGTEIASRENNRLWMEIMRKVSLVLTQVLWHS